MQPWYPNPPCVGDSSKRLHTGRDGELVQNSLKLPNCVLTIVMDAAP